MKELSLNILDIAQNSVKARATLIGITLIESDSKLSFEITDNGCGMTRQQVDNLRDPFFTTRTTRKVGLGIPFLVLAAEQTGGRVEIASRSEKEFPDDHGTRVYAEFIKDSIDYTPLGDIVSTVITLIHGADGIDYEFRHEMPGGCAELSTKQMREVLGEGVSLSEPDVLAWAEEYLRSMYEKN